MATLFLKEPFAAASGKNDHILFDSPQMGNIVNPEQPKQRTIFGGPNPANLFACWNFQGACNWPCIMLAPTVWANKPFFPTIGGFWLNLERIFRVFSEVVLREKWKSSKFAFKYLDYQDLYS